MRPVRVPHGHHMTLTLSNPRLMTGGPDGRRLCRQNPYKSYGLIAELEQFCFCCCCCGV